MLQMNIKQHIIGPSFESCINKPWRRYPCAKGPELILGSIEVVCRQLCTMRSESRLVLYVGNRPWGCGPFVDISSRW